MKKLNSLIDQLESHIADFEKTNSAVSTSTIGWQIDHSFLVINKVVSDIKNSNPENYKWKFNWKRSLIQIINKIPRGKAKAPQVVQPTESSSIEKLTEKFDLAKKSIAELELLPATSYFKHPYFGDLNLKSAIWFLKLHTKHHLKIIKDIVKN
ncbi:DUF1569 domain-containing protein [Flavobacterium sp.]|uniref:DUF1569 domain-containing protein n=1 Tax=Flavobacterium sp. TaxID=239 RepID=UPI0025DAB8C7|nr:DUF1569 domain-containing protein [Flavobacterium sp.]